MEEIYQAISRLARNTLFTLLLTSSVTQFAVAQEPSQDRPRRLEGQGRALEGEGGGRREMAENKTPTAPNPGQTVGLFLK